MVSVLCYGAEAWWPGRRRSRQDLSGRQKLISNGVGAQLACLDRILRSALLGTLPVYRTTRTAVLHRESAILPMELLLDQGRRSLAIRIHQLDTQHPLHLRVMHQPSRYISTRLLRAVDLKNFHRIEQVDPLSSSPWDSHKCKAEIMDKTDNFDGRFYTAIHERKRQEDFIVLVLTLSRG